MRGNLLFVLRKNAVEKASFLMRRSATLIRETVAFSASEKYRRRRKVEPPDSIVAFLTIIDDGTGKPLPSAIEIRDCALQSDGSSN